MLQKLIDTIYESEGSVCHMYCDSKGNVTVAVGKALFKPEQAMDLAFRLTANGQPASKQLIADEWRRVKAAYRKNHTAAYYRQFTQMFLTARDIGGLLQSHLLDLRVSMTKRFPELDQWPASAQMAALDMGYNLGLTKLRRKFPNFCRALEAKDWKTAAQECHRLDIDETRNRVTRDWLLAA